MKPVSWSALARRFGEPVFSAFHFASGEILYQTMSGRVVDQYGATRADAAHHFASNCQIISLEDAMKITAREPWRAKF